MARAGAQCGTHALKTYVIIQRSLEPPYTAVVEQLRRGPDEWREPAGALVRAARGTRQREASGRQLQPLARRNAGHGTRIRKRRVPRERETIVRNGFRGEFSAYSNPGLRIVPIPLYEHSLPTPPFLDPQARFPRAGSLH